MAHIADDHLRKFKRIRIEITNSSWITPKVRVLLSTLGGKGLFAVDEIKKGEQVVVWKGDYAGEIEARQAKEKGKLVMQWDTNLFSIEDRGDDIGYYVNHSCDSNLWMKDAYTLIARRAIKKSEEITADYALWEADGNYVSTWACNCGSTNCRKKVTGKDWRLPEVQKKYNGHFSPLLNKRIAHLLH